MNYNDRDMWDLGAEGNETMMGLSGDTGDISFGVFDQSTQNDPKVKPEDPIIEDVAVSADRLEAIKALIELAEMMQDDSQDVSEPTKPEPSEGIDVTPINDALDRVFEEQGYKVTAIDPSEILDKLSTHDTKFVVTARLIEVLNDRCKDLNEALSHTNDAGMLMNRTVERLVTHVHNLEQRIEQLENDSHTNTPEDVVDADTSGYDTTDFDGNRVTRKESYMVAKTRGDCGFLSVKIVDGLFQDNTLTQMNHIRGDYDFSFPIELTYRIWASSNVVKRKFYNRDELQCYIDGYIAAIGE